MSKVIWLTLAVIFSVGVLSADTSPPGETRSKVRATHTGAAKLSTGQRSQWNYLQGLLRRFGETTDQGMREIFARDYLSGSRGFREVFAENPEYWRARARMALELNDEKPGKEAAGKMFKLQQPEDYALMSRLRQRGWVPDGSEKARLGGDFVLHVLQLPMIFIEPGSFVMGNPTVENEGPLTQVTLTHPFWIGRHEITRAQWRIVMEADPGDVEQRSVPMVEISWVDVQVYCAKLTAFEQAAGRLPPGYAYSLPTEAQWEYVCRAGTTTDTVEDLDEVAWYANNSSNRLHAVGGKRPNAWGIYNMLGNASEWCLDSYAVRLSGGQQTNPIGSEHGSMMVVRGGNYASIATNCRITKRGGNLQEGASDKIGFRVVLTRVGD